MKFLRKTIEYLRKCFKEAEARQEWNAEQYLLDETRKESIYD